MAQITQSAALVLIDFDGDERSFLQSVLGDLQEAFDALEPDDPVRRRLLPDGYRDDEQAAAEYREMTQRSLIEGKTDAVGSCLAELASVVGEDSQIRLALDSDAFARWLRVLTDVRLALGTRIGVSDQRPSLMAQLRMSASERAAWGAYGWLTELQDSLVELAMGDSPD